MSDGLIAIDDKVAQLEQEMHRMTEAQVELEPLHHFAKGMYIRELFIPKGTLVSGKIHKHEHIILLLSGEMSLWTENGVVRVKAPYFNIAPPGTKRLGYAHEDTIGMNIHATGTTDLEELETELTCDSFEEYQDFITAALATPLIGG
jgi:quercetin dioxygenase-like cupin family protein